MKHFVAVLAGRCMSTGLNTQSPSDDTFHNTSEHSTYYVLLLLVITYNQPPNVMTEMRTLNWNSLLITDSLTSLCAWCLLFMKRRNVTAAVFLYKHFICHLRGKVQLILLWYWMDKSIYLDTNLPANLYGPFCLLLHELNGLEETITIQPIRTLGLFHIVKSIG